MFEYEKEMLDLIDSGKELSEDELGELVFEFGINTEYGDNRRWSRSATTIVAVGGRYFKVKWEDGLTEYQDNVYDSQPVEVIPVEKTKTITYTAYVPVKGEQSC